MMSLEKLAQCQTVEAMAEVLARAKVAGFWGDLGGQAMDVVNKAPTDWRYGAGLGAAVGGLGGLGAGLLGSKKRPWGLSALHGAALGGLAGAAVPAVGSLFAASGGGGGSGGETPPPGGSQPVKPNYSGARSITGIGSDIYNGGTKLISGDPAVTPQAEATGKDLRAYPKMIAEKGMDSARTYGAAHPLQTLGTTIGGLAGGVLGKQNQTNRDMRGYLGDDAKGKTEQAGKGPSATPSLIGSLSPANRWRDTFGEMPLLRNIWGKDQPPTPLGAYKSLAPLVGREAITAGVEKVLPEIMRGAGADQAKALGTIDSSVASTTKSLEAAKAEAAALSGKYEPLGTVGSPLAKGTQARDYAHSWLRNRQADLTAKVQAAESGAAGPEGVRQAKLLREQLTEATSQLAKVQQGAAYPSDVMRQHLNRESVVADDNIKSWQTKLDKDLPEQAAVRDKLHTARAANARGVRDLLIKARTPKPGVVAGASRLGRPGIGGILGALLGYTGGYLGDHYGLYPAYEGLQNSNAFSGF